MNPPANIVERDRIFVIHEYLSEKLERPPVNIVVGITIDMPIESQCTVTECVYGWKIHSAANDSIKGTSQNV